MNQDTKSFFGGLESLRGVAALIVVFLHIKWANPLTSLLFFRNGYLMVDLFFVLSGFVICHNYGRKIGNTGDVGHFMFLRFGRLYPLHLFCLIIFLGIEVAKYIGQLKFNLVPYATSAFSINNASSFVANLLLVQTFCPSAIVTFNVPSWSISAEFYTYLVFAAVILTFPGKKPVLLVSGFLVLLAAFLLIFFGVSGVTELTGWSFLRCVLGFFTGVLAYHLYGRFHPTISRWSGSGKIIVMLLSVLAVFMSFEENARLDGILVLPVFLALIVTIAAEPPGVITKMLGRAPLRWLGRVSYSIYMMHLMVLMLVSRCFAFTQSHFNPVYRNGLGLAFVFLAVALVLMISQLTYQWIEVPYRKTFRDLSGKYFKPWQSRV
jgi:peptidoglycan/LPS O-acetylase OafA/YrhL